MLMTHMDAPPPDINVHSRYFPLRRVMRRDLLLSGAASDANFMHVDDFSRFPRHPDGKRATEVGRLSAQPCRDACRDRGFIGHLAPASIRCASARSTDPIDIISIAIPVSARTSIMVATRRNAANESPSIISSSVITS
jgi:hypothetical protein